MSAGATQTRDFSWLTRSIPPAAQRCGARRDLGLGGAGPDGADEPRAARDADAPTDLASAAFPFATSQIIDMGYARVRASRITYVGELGWELYIPTEFAQSVFDVIVAAGAPFGLQLAGYHALNCLRIEKAYRHWGHDISDEDTPLEAGLAVRGRWTSPAASSAASALLEQRAAGVRRRLVAFASCGSRPICSTTTSRSGATGRWSAVSARGCSGTPSAPRSVSATSPREKEPVNAEWLANGRYEVEIAGERIPARVSLRPFYDPAGERVKS